MLRASLALRAWPCKGCARSACMATAVIVCLCCPPARAAPLDTSLPPGKVQPVVPPAAPDLRGIKRDTAYFLGYQLAAIALISVWPQDDSNGSSKEELGFDRWWYNVTHPHWDSDDWFINYVTHPYWGAAYYIRARERGLSRAQSFWYSTLLSTVYEYGAEAMIERPSYQDLWVTPVMGSLLGEFVFAPWREHIRAKNEPLGTSDRLVLVLTDPLDAINGAVDRLLGIESELSLGPVLPQESWRQRFHATGGPHLPATQRASRPRWGLQWHVRW